MESLKHLDFFNSTIPATLEYYDNKKVNEVQYFSLGLLRRLLHASQSLKILLNDVHKVPEVEFSSGLILRAILLDMLISLNFYKLIKDNLLKKLSDEEMKISTIEFCNIFLADGLDQTAKYLQLAVSMGLKTEVELKEAFNIFAKNYSIYFENHFGDGTMPKSKFPKADGPTGLFKKLAGDNEMKWISGIYDTYLYYSKYDHFGILYYDTAIENHSQKIQKIEKATRMFTRHCTIIYDVLDRVSQKDSFIENEYKKVGAYMLSVINDGL